MPASPERRRPLRTLLFESSLVGHGFDYVSLQVPAFLEFGPVTLYTLPESLENRVFMDFADKYRSRGFVVDASVRKHLPSGWGNLWHGYWNLVRAVKRHKPDLVFITGGGNFLKAFSLFKAHWLVVRPSRCRVELIIFKLSGAYPAESMRRRMTNLIELRLIARSPVDKVHISDVFTYRYLSGKPGIRQDLINMCPDPIGIFSAEVKGKSSEFRAKLGLPTDGRWIGCSGVIDERKGIPLLLDAFARAELKDTDRLLLAGQASPGVRNLLKNGYAGLIECGRIVCLDRFLTKEEFDDSILAVDVVCTPYPRHQGPASIILRAAASRRPVLSSNYGWLGWITERFELGKICDVSDIPRFSRAIVDALENAYAYTPNSEVERLLQFNASDNFCGHITEKVRRILGESAAPPITWESLFG